MEIFQQQQKKSRERIVIKTKQSRATFPPLTTFAIIVKNQRTQVSLLLPAGNDIEQWCSQEAKRAEVACLENQGALYNLRMVIAGCHRSKSIDLALNSNR